MIETLNHIETYFNSPPQRVNGVGWHLALQGTPLFPEPLKAWVHGPAVHQVYQQFKNYGYDPIPVSEGESEDEIPKDVRDFVISIWAAYRGFSAPKLKDMTHREAPWKQARAGLSDSANSSADIPRESMREFFIGQYQHRAIPGLELEKLKQAEREFAQGRGIPMNEVFADLDE